MLVELTAVRADSADFPRERRRDVHDVVDVIPHDQQKLRDAMRSEPSGSMTRIVEWSRCPEVTRLHDSEADRPMIGV